MRQSLDHSDGGNDVDDVIRHASCLCLGDGYKEVTRFDAVQFMRLLFILALERPLNTDNDHRLE